MTNLTPADLHRFAFVGDPRLSPDGSRVAYVRTIIDPRGNTYRSAIHVAPARGGEGSSHPPYTGGARDGSPRWSPDGRYLAFLSDRPLGHEAEEAEGDRGAEGKNRGRQVWVLPAGGGEARPATNIKGGVGSFQWAPDSRRLAFIAAVPSSGPEFLDEGLADGKKAPEDADGAGETPKVESDGEASPWDVMGRAPDLEPSSKKLYRKYNSDVHRIKSAFYRYDGLGYFGDRHPQVFVADAASATGRPGGPPPRPVQITDGPYHHSDFAWSPDGTRLAVAVCRHPRPEFQRFSDIWLYRADEKDESPVCITNSTGPARAPSWSPDGSTIAFLGDDQPYGWYSDTRIWLAHVPEDGPAQSPESGGAGSADPADRPKKLKNLTAAFDRSIGDVSITDMRMAGGVGARPAWSPDGAFLYTVASRDGRTQVHRVSTATGRVEPVTDVPGVIFDAHVSPEAGLVAAAVATRDNPNEIYVGPLPPVPPAAGDGTHEPGESDPGEAPPAERPMASLDPVTRVNADLLARRTVSEPEEFWFRADGGPRAQGWVIKPVGWQEGEKYPAVLQIHGGPMAMYTDTFFLEFQLLAAAGIGVIFTNPRGSQGYGEEFCSGIKDDWGTNDYADIMAGLEEALSLHPWIDEDRLGVAGGSYGGWMTALITTRTDMFKAACVMRPVINFYSFFGSSDLGHMWDDVIGGGRPPWENPERWLRQSPIAHVGSVKTPTLIIHSENDYRCLVEQAEQWHKALEYLEVETEFLRYPGESHGLSRGGQPWHRVHRLHSIVSWFEGHLKGDGSGANS